MTIYLGWRTASTIAASCLISACSGGGGSSDAGFSDLSDRGMALVEETENVEPTPIDNMPANGSATYEGVGGFALGYQPADLEDLEVLAELEMEADFGASSVSGNMSNFRDSANTKYEGSVEISNGQITDNELTADLSGTVSGDGDTARISGTMDGMFGGDNAEYVDGTLQGEAGFERDASEEIYGVFGGKAR